MGRPTAIAARARGPTEEAPRSASNTLPTMARGVCAPLSWPEFRPGRRTLRGHGRRSTCASEGEGGLTRPGADRPVTRAQAAVRNKLEESAVLFCSDRHFSRKLPPN